MYLLKFVFLKKRYALFPKSLRALWVLPLGGILIVVMKNLPHFSSGIINIAVFSGTSFFFYFLVAYKFKLAPELNDFLNKQLVRLNLKPLD